MAKMVPDYIDQEDPRRNGERMVFEWFSNPSIPGTAYYSMLQKNHRHKFIGEVDFLYVCERGFLCIEVKGGQDIYRNDGKWYSVNRLGKANEIHNPFVQAKDCQYALKDYFTKTYGRYSEQADYPVGYAVVFPECRFTGSGNDLVTEVVYDAKYDLADFPGYLEKVFDYWENLEITRHNHRPRRLSSEQLRQANDLLRGDFHVVPSMHLELQHIEQQMVKLTDNQYDVLDAVEYNSKSIVRGGAGTGKTLLALALTRKNASKGKKTLYLCFNGNMGEYAEISLDNCPNTEAKTFHSLIMNELDDSSLYKTSPEELARVFLSSGRKTDLKYDAIVIDEGQDLLNYEVLDSIAQFLHGGLEKGQWTIFLDPNQNIFNNNSIFDETMEYICELYHPSILPLTTNCRNTQPIANRTAALTLTPPAKNLKLSGPRVITKTYDNATTFITSFTRELQALLSSGIPATDIAVLSRYKKENSLLSSVDRICNLNVVERKDIKSFGERCLNYYTVQSFKGLESRIVFYIDVDGFGSIDDRMLNYVAMSRALLQLYVFYDAAKKADYEETLDKGRDLLA